MLAQTITKPELSADGKQVILTTPTLVQGAKWKEIHALVNGEEVCDRARCN
jgi:hypothetical protein